MKKFKRHDEFETFLRLISPTNYFADNTTTNLYICRECSSRNLKTIYIPFTLKENIYY